ncbi:MAG: septum formation initiator [Geminicoccus sp.]|nr:septum formation initiator [Geminicoccus sp.]
MIARRLAQIARTYLPVAFFTATALYFIFHLVTGDRGLLAYIAIKRELDDATVILAELEVEKQDLQRDVSLLYDTPIDVDMLEERARVELGFVREDETIILHPKAD